VGLSKFEFLKPHPRMWPTLFPHLLLSTTARVTCPNPLSPLKTRPTIPLSQQLHSIDWFQFEKLVELAYSPTHKVTRRGGANPDGGIDLIIEEAGELIAVQCKHWKAWKVGVRNVRELTAAMIDEGLKKGIIVTIKGYSKDAADFARRHGIELINEKGVLDLLRLADQGAVQKILEDKRKICPKCEREMVVRTASKGSNAGGQFWGCSGFPRCRFIIRDASLVQAGVANVFS
jgi:restriction system protein